jgi:hypothetical protein
MDFRVDDVPYHYLFPQSRIKHSHHDTTCNSKTEQTRSRMASTPAAGNNKLKISNLLPGILDKKSSTAPVAQVEI